MSQITQFYKIVTPKSKNQSYLSQTKLYPDSYSTVGTTGQMTYFNQIARGIGSRFQSYTQYDHMDNDIDISRSLDIIAEEMSEKDEKTNLPFIIEWQKEDNEDISDQTVITVRAALRHWSTIQDLNNRTFSISRTLIKYGDCFFRKLSDTRKWVYVHPSMISGIEINHLGEKVAYHVKNLSQENVPSQFYNRNAELVDIVPVEGMIHFTLSDDMGTEAPFGASVLRPIYRVYKQLSMLEDACIIYKLVRAPERRVFYIDVGNQNPAQVKKYLDAVRTDMRQKRTPYVNQQGKESIDGQFNPESIQEDYFFPVSASGKSSRVETLPGGSEDFGTVLLRKFEEKIFRGLRIPTSYLSGTDGQNAQYNDGKVGIMYVEELRFSKFVMRLQSRLNLIFDEQFKIFMRVCDLNVDEELYNIRLPDPTNFAKYRQAALDADLINAATQLDGFEYISKRLIIQRYLGLTDDEFQMNEMMLKEERGISDDDPEMIRKLYDKSFTGENVGDTGGELSSPFDNVQSESPEQEPEPEIEPEIEQGEIPSTEEIPNSESETPESSEQTELPK